MYAFKHERYRYCLHTALYVLHCDVHILTYCVTNCEFRLHFSWKSDLIYNSIIVNTSCLYYLEAVIIMNTACLYYLEAAIIAILPLCFVIIWSRDVSDGILVKLSYIYAVNAYHSLRLWVRIQYKTGLFNTTFCDKDCQWLRTARLFFTELLSIYAKAQYHW